MDMRKFLDFFLIGALGLNIFNLLKNDSLQIEVLGLHMPTWIAVVIQVFCILLLGFKLYKNHVAERNSNK